MILIKDLIELLLQNGADPYKTDRFDYDSFRITKILQLPKTNILFLIYTQRKNMIKYEDYNIRIFYNK